MNTDTELSNKKSGSITKKGKSRILKWTIFYISLINAVFIIFTNLFTDIFQDWAFYLGSMLLSAGLFPILHYKISKIFEKTIQESEYYTTLPKSHQGNTSETMKDFDSNEMLMGCLLESQKYLDDAGKLLEWEFMLSEKNLEFDSKIEKEDDWAWALEENNMGSLEEIIKNIVVRGKKTKNGDKK